MLRVCPFARCRWRTFPRVVALSCAVVHGAAAQQVVELPRADGKTTPVKVYGAGNPCGRLLVLSHGLGGTEHAFAGLAAAAVAEGFQVYVMGHAESGRRRLRAALRGLERRRAIAEAAGNAAAHQARFFDLDATWSAATRGCRPRLAVLGGHSMGAQTVMMEAGAVARIGRMGRNRFDAYLAFSPQGIGLRYGQEAWRGIRKPVLMVTGTHDRGLDGDYRTRLSAFDRLPPGGKRLAVIDGANHFNVGGHGVRALAQLPQAIALQFLRDLEGGRLRKAQPIDGVMIREK